MVGLPRPVDHAEDDPGGLQDHRRLVIAPPPSAYDDELWQLAASHTHARAPEHLVAFVRSLGEVDAALDLGCGQGLLTREVAATRVLVGADVSPVALSRARARLPEAVELVELTPGEALPFADNEFELVLCAETIEHVQDVQLFLSEARRVLRSGGRLALTTPARLPLMRVPDPLSPHIRFFTRGSLRRLLREMGFEVDSLRREAGTLMAVASR